MLAAEYRDGPPSVDGGYCQPLWVMPAAWRVVLEKRRYVHDPQRRPGRREPDVTIRRTHNLPG
jgi:hypothetical protein